MNGTFRAARAIIMARKSEKTSAEWKQQLPQNQYFITRPKRGRKPPFTGSTKIRKRRAPTNVFAAQLLFRSDAKFHSGSGWPSFYAPASEELWSRRRIRAMDEADGGEVQPCDAHLGHVLTMGSQPTGMRYCINSVALELRKIRKRHGSHRDAFSSSDFLRI